MVRLALWALCMAKASSLCSAVGLEVERHNGEMAV